MHSCLQYSVFCTSTTWVCDSMELKDNVLLKWFSVNVTAYIGSNRLQSKFGED